MKGIPPLQPDGKDLGVLFQRCVETTFDIGIFLDNPQLGRADPFQSANGSLLVWGPVVVWDSNRGTPKNSQSRSFSGIQTTGPQTTKYITTWFQETAGNICPQIINFNRVFNHYKPSIFWGFPPIFGNTHIDENHSDVFVVEKVFYEITEFTQIWPGFFFVGREIFRYLKPKFPDPNFLSSICSDVANARSEK